MVPMNFKSKKKNNKLTEIIIHLKEKIHNYVKFLVMI